MTILDHIEALAENMRRHAVISLVRQQGGESLTLRLTEGADPHRPTGVTAPCGTATPPMIPVRSPEMGVFRVADLPPDRQVQAGAVIGFVELGVVRLPVAAPLAGRLLPPLRDDGDIVGYHDTLFDLDAG